MTYFTTLLMLAFLVNNIAFTHTHITNDGLVVQHAHPYAKELPQRTSDSQGHTHTDKDYFVLNQLNLLFLVLAAVVLIVTIVKLILEHLLYQSKLIDNTYSYALLRAPPLKNTPCYFFE
jgi:hypothetical protein